MGQSNEGANRQSAEMFEQYRSRLFSIAYRMTGSVMEAEDLVQETYLRYRLLDVAKIDSMQAYLTTIVTRLAINVLNSSRVRREHYVGPWLPEPLPTAQHAQMELPSEHSSRYDSISTAFLLMLERLSPLERAVFLLHEVFDYKYGEIALILERSEEACRKLGGRAKRHVRARRPRFDVSAQDYQDVIGRFLDACRNGNLHNLVSLLAEGATFYSDGGGKATAGKLPVRGQRQVAQFILGGMRLIAEQDYVWEILELNGRPAVLVRIAGKVFGAVLLELGPSQEIVEIHFITNPDKLNHL